MKKGRRWRRKCSRNGTWEKRRRIVKVVKREKEKGRKIAKGRARSTIENGKWRWQTK